MLVRIVTCAKPKRLTGVVVLPDEAAGRARELVRPPDDGLQHRLEVERRAQRPTYLPKGRELADRARQVLRPGLEFLEQADVLDGDDGLIGEGLD